MCESGPGRPKADGTQDCECSIQLKTTLKAGKIIHCTVTSKGDKCYTYIGYHYSSNNGTLTNKNYRGKEILKFASIGGKTRIEFKNSKGLPTSDRYVLINGIKYTFKYYWGMYIYEGEIFSEGKSYGIEIIN